MKTCENTDMQAYNYTHIQNANMQRSEHKHTKIQTYGRANMQTDKRAKTHSHVHANLPTHKNKHNNMQTYRPANIEL